MPKNLARATVGTLRTGELNRETPYASGLGTGPMPAEGEDWVRDDRMDMADMELARAKHLTKGDVGNGAPNVVASRELSRSIARRVDAKERKALHEERAKLAWKQVTGELRPEEEWRLSLLRWIIERIEDAELGPGLDRLERIAELIETQAKHIADFTAEARRHKPPSPFFSKARQTKR